MISIIIPTYNRAEMLAEIVACSLQGGAGNFECVVVDDASTDKTSEIMKNLQATWGPENLTYERMASNQGAQVARNRGISASNGEFLMFMDSDDMPNPAGIHQLHAHLLKHELLEYCYGRVIKTDAHLNHPDTDRGIGESFEPSPRETAGYHWHTMGALYRRRCIEMVGPWNTDLTGSQDWEYQARVKLFGGRGQFVDFLVGWWRQHDGDRVGTTAFRPDYVKSVMLACDSILTHARAANRCDAALEQRIAKKLILHALEWGKNGYPEMRKECLRLALGHLTHGQPLKSLIRVAIHSPTVFDGHAWHLLTRRNH